MGPKNNIYHYESWGKLAVLDLNNVLANEKPTI